MSALLSTYLHDILDASGCTEAIFVQDNCAGPIHHASKTVADETLGDGSDCTTCSASIPELSRWDSSSSSLTNAIALKSPEKKQTVRSLRPPRRQISFDTDLCSDMSDNDEEDATRRRQQQTTNNPLGFPIATANSAPRKRHPTNTPPRPPPRRTSSRLKKFLLRTLETHMDCFPSSSSVDDHQDETVVTWPPPNSKLSTHTLLGDDDDDDEGRIETIPSKLIPLQLGRQPQSLEAFLVDMRKNASPSSVTTCVVDDEDIAPPRKPRRQTTDELLNNVAKGEQGAGDSPSLHGLMRLSRCRVKSS